MPTREQKLEQKKKQDEKNKGDSLPKAPSLPAPTTPTSTSLKPVTDPMSFANLANSLLPYFSTQDQLAVKAFLNTQDPTGVYKDYLGTTSSEPPAIRAEDARGFMSAERAKNALAKLDSMRTAAGLTEEQLGSGYKYIKQAISLLANLGVNSATGEQGMTRAEFENMQAQLAALNSQAQSDKTLAPYAELATKFINPTLIGTLYPTSTSNGRTSYGQSNKKLFY